MYFCTLCNDADEGKKLVQAAMNALLAMPVSGKSDSIPIDQSESADMKPIVFWSAFYIQNVTMVCFLS